MITYYLIKFRRLFIRFEYFKISQDRLYIKARLDQFAYFMECSIIRDFPFDNCEHEEIVMCSESVRLNIVRYVRLQATN